VLQAAEQRGYFSLVRGGARAVDRVASSLAPEDLDRLAENLAVVLAAFKELDQPADAGIRSLFRQIRDPEVQRGLAATLRVLRVIGANTTVGGADGKADAPTEAKNPAAEPPSR
jgi:hypothetical protein